MASDTTDLLATKFNKAIKDTADAQGKVDVRDVVAASASMIEAYVKELPLEERRELLDKSLDLFITLRDELC